MSEASIRDKLIETAAKLLDDEGPAALSTRRLAKEVGVSTMAVYTHFGGMPELFRAIVQEGFDRFAGFLNAVAVTDDPLRDLLDLAHAYRAFATRNPHLYAVMFGGSSGRLTVDRTEIANCDATFEVLVAATTRVLDAGLFRAADPGEVAGQLWAAAHGFVQLEAAGLIPYDGGGSAEAVWTGLLTTLGNGLQARTDGPAPTGPPDSR